jgi:hypothetical protein
MSVVHDAIKCRTPATSLRLIILHAFAGPLISFPSTIKPPPKTSELWVNKTLLFFVSKTLSQFDGSVAQLPFNSNALAEKLSRIQVAHKSFRAADLDILLSSFDGSTDYAPELASIPITITKSCVGLWSGSLFEDADNQ